VGVIVVEDSGRNSGIGSDLPDPQFIIPADTKLAGLGRPDPHNVTLGINPR
jgi:hypothetical protein